MKDMKDKYITKKKRWEKPKLNKLQFKNTFDGIFPDGHEKTAVSYS